MVHFSMRKREMGIAQIPLMLGLLLMAVALPAVTKLSKENQDNRNRAAGQLSIPIGLCSCSNGVYGGANCPPNAVGQPCTVTTPPPSGSCGTMPSTSCPMQGQTQVCKNGQWTCGIPCTAGDLGSGCCNGSTLGHQVRDANCRITCSGNYGACNISPTKAPVLPGSCTTCSTFESQCTAAGGTVTTNNGIKFCGYGGTATCAGVTGGGGDPCLNNGGICTGTSIQKCKCGDSYIGVNTGANCTQACSTAGIVCTNNTCTNTEGPESTPLPTNPIKLPTSTPIPTTPPSPLACGEICGQGVACASGLTCVSAVNGGKYCSMPALAAACSANPSMGSCCATSTIPPTQTPTPTPKAPTPSVCEAKSTISCRSANDPNPAWQCRYVTITDVCGVVTNEVGEWCCPNPTPTTKIPTPTNTNTPTPSPTKVPTITPTPTSSVCKNCQYQTDLFWGPVIESFNGGVRYSTLNRLIAAKSNFSSLPGCVLEEAPRLPAPTIEPMPSECTNPMSKGLLTGSIDTSYVNIPNGYIKGKVTNKSKTCSYDVGLASYKANGSNIDTQNLYDYKTQTILPGESVEFVVKSPMNNDELNCHNLPSITPTKVPTTTPTRVPTVTPTKRPSPTPTPAACVFPRPKDPPKATCAPIGGKGSIDWIWPAVNQAVEYEVDIYKSNGSLLVNNNWRPATDFNCQNGGDCKFTTNNLPVGAYYSRIRARNLSICQASEWSKSDNISVTNCTTPTPIISCNKKLDISIVIDRSGSMTSLESDKRTKLEWAKDAAKTLAQAIQKAKQNASVRVSVVSFGAQGNDGKGTLASNRNSTLHTPLTNNHGQVVSSISTLRYVESGTCVECGLRIGNDQLTDKNTRRVQILLSDGMANRNWNGTGYLSSTNNPIVNAKNEANKGRANGIEYRTIGFGRKDIKGQIDEATLVAIAGSNANYQYKPNAGEWSSAFMEILAELCKE